MKIVVFTLLIIVVQSENTYSKVSFDDNLIRNTGIHFATFHNVCIDNKPDSMFINIIYYINNMEDFYSIGYYLLDHRLGFLSDSISFHLSSYPNYHIYNDSNIWLSRGCCFTISHFMDFVSFWIMNQNSSLYPSIDSLIFTQFQPNTFYEYHTVLYNMFIQKKVKVKFAYDLNKLMRKNGIICFKKMYYMIRSENGNYGMIYRNIKVRKQFRDHCYKNMKLEYSKIENINCLFIYRKAKLANRILTNQKVVLKMMKLMGLDVKVTYFDGKSVKEQINIIKDVNLIINVYGSSLTNLLWLSSNKAFVIELTGIYSFSDLPRYTIVNGYVYISLFTAHHSIDYNSIYYDDLFETFPCFHQSVEYSHPLFITSGYNITTSLHQLKNALYYGINYLKFSFSYNKFIK